MQIIYVSYPLKYFYLRNRIYKFVLDNKNFPIDMFKIFDVVLDDINDSKYSALIADMKKNIIPKCDEIWVFEEIHDFMLEDITIAKKKNVPIKYVTLETIVRFITPEEIKFSKSLLKRYNTEDLQKMIEVKFAS